MGFSRIYASRSPAFSLGALSRSLSTVFEHMPVNAGVPQDCELSPSLFLLHINYILEDSNIHCYANGTGDAFFSAAQVFSRENVDHCRNKLVSSVEASLGTVSTWGEKNPTQFNPKKTQVCVLPTKKTPLRDASLPKHSSYIHGQYQYIGF